MWIGLHGAASTLPGKFTDYNGERNFTLLGDFSCLIVEYSLETLDQLICRKQAILLITLPFLIFEISHSVPGSEIV